MNELSASPIIKGHFIYRPIDQVRAVWALFRLIRIAGWVAGVLLAFLLLVELFDDLFDTDSTTLEPLLYLAAAMIAWPVLISASVWRLSPQQKDVTYLIDGERLVVRDAAGNEVSSLWSGVTRLEEFRTGYLVRLGAAGRWFAKRAFTPEARAALRALAREKLGDRARLLS
jgi:hypothetical protein